MKSSRRNILQKNDIIDIIAPASSASLIDIQEGMNFLKKLGLRPRIPQELLERKSQKSQKKDMNNIFFAHSLEYQWQHLKNALFSDSKAIWCLRGGYGSMRLIPELQKITPPPAPKIFIGLSDITSLHLFFTQSWKWPVIHGRNLADMSSKNASKGDHLLLKKILMGQTFEKTFKKLKPLNLLATKNKTLIAPLSGGNLRIIQSSLKTPWEIQTHNKIIFLEDIGERGYSIDRMLEQLYQSQLLKSGIKAVIFGDFLGGDEKNGKNFIHFALQRFAQRVNFPVLAGLPSGHGKEINFPLPFNTKSQLHLGTCPYLTCHYDTF